MTSWRAVDQLPTPQRAPLLWLLLPYAAGVIACGAGAGTGWGTMAWYGLAAGSVIVAAGALALRRPTAWAVALVAGMLALGVARGIQSDDEPPGWRGLPPREATLTVQLDHVFTPPAGGGRASGMATVRAAPHHLADLVGRRIFVGFKLDDEQPTPVRTARLELLGVLSLVDGDVTPAPGSFDAYLLDSGIHLALKRARVVRDVAPPTAYAAACDRLAQHMARILGEGLDDRPDLSGVLRAMMLGRKQELSDEQGEIFLRSGTMHLFAISGLHIAAIALALHFVLMAVRLPGWIAFVVEAALLWVFVAATGQAPSAVRGWCMVVAIEAAFRLRAPGRGLAALTAAAWAVLLYAPRDIFGASFQMSYGIVLALLLYGLPLSAALGSRTALWKDLPQVSWRWSHRLADRAWRFLVMGLSLGLASSMVSAVNGVTFFQLLTPGALLANLVLIPLATLVIWAGCASLACGLVGCTLGSVCFNHAAALLIAGIQGLVGLFVRVPGVAWAATWRYPALGGAAAIALVVAWLACSSRRRAQPPRWWIAPAVVATVLILGVRVSPLP